jgi:cytochrome c oxidase assembly protein subunit 15
MQASFDLAQLLIHGLLAACIPLSMVWMSSDSNKYRKLVWVTAFLTFDLIVFGGFTRLTDSGLGCPDWPGCYGLANPFLAHEHIAAAEALMPTGPVTVAKAWIEMIHRYLAMGIGVLIMALMITSWVQWRRTRERAFNPPAADPAVPVGLRAGRVRRLDRDPEAAAGDRHPAPAARHDPAGDAGLAGRARGLPAETASPRPPDLASALRACAAGLAVGRRAAGPDRAGRVGEHQLRDPGLHRFPLVRRQVVPEMDFEHGFTLWRELGKTAAGHYLPFPALTAIHWVHRNFAAVVCWCWAYTAWRAWPCRAAPDGAIWRWCWPRRPSPASPPCT